jgi:Gpi18-like mannosyltransferase
VLAAIVLTAFAVRFLFIDQVSGDYRAFVSPWYDYLDANGGFAAVGADISNYNPPYLYLLAAAGYLPLSKIVAIKLISMVFEVLLAAFAALIVRQRFPGPVVPLLSFAVVLFAPTVVINSAAWGQCDSIYSAFCLGSLYFLLRNKPWWAAAFFGVALSFKLQAIFFMPVLMIVVVVNRQRLLALLAVPAAFAVMLVPAILAGRDLTGLLMIYPHQVATGGTATAGAGIPENGAGGRSGAGQLARGGGSAPSGSTGGREFGRPGGAGNALTQNAPTFYQWLGTSAGGIWKYLGLAASALVVAGVAVTTWLRRRPLTAAEIVVVATTVVLAVPFFLPEMHERYFYLADVLTIVMAFYVRRFWPVAVVVSACSLLSYAPFLWGRTIVPLPLVAFAEFLAVIATGLFFVAIVGRGDHRLLRTCPTRPAEPRRPIDAAAQ